VQHCTPEQLALAALREPLPADDAAHLESCDQCRAEVASLRRAVDALAVPEFAGSVPPVSPPPAVWAAVAAATGVAAAPSTADGPPPPAADGNNVRQLRPRRARLLLAAAAVAVVAAGAGAIAVNRDHDVVVASAALDPLEPADVSGKASVVEEKDGTRVLRIELDAPAPRGDYYEAWLADKSAVGMVSMGAVRPGTTSLPVPDGLDLAKWPTVEISVEPMDGQPGHSGVSLVRGQLDT
jgi:anti-sigma factor RsiW